ncbi:MAG TPA: AAA family ATPase, partial [Actinoplanes sp.]|nr:AAA family ATPase [Actinoplanes sp.]
MPAALRIRLLGGFQAEVAGRRVADGEWQRSGATALVKVLALQHRLQRDQAVDLLWPEAAAELGVRRINKSLHFARRVLGADRILLRDSMLGLARTDLWTDVDAFEAAARAGDIEAALALYTGDLLPENRFDDWAEPRRTQLRDAVVPLLLAHATGSDPRTAEQDLVRLVALDPLHEEAYARLMRLEVDRGRRHLALRWYDRLAGVLRSEIGVEPREDLQRLHRDLAASRAERASGDGQPNTNEQPNRSVRPTDAGGSSTGRSSSDRPVAEERKLVTVLDADLRGVRGAAADPDPESARREIAGWTELIREIVVRWGGAAQPLLGGGVIGIFGYPIAREDHAARALWAGSEILRRLPAPVRLGVDTGEIIAPAPATDERAELSRIGGAVLDTAARLRVAAAPRTVLVAQRTRHAVDHSEFSFDVTHPGDDRTLVAYRLLASARDPAVRTEGRSSVAESSGFGRAAARAAETPTNRHADDQATETPANSHADDQATETPTIGRAHYRATEAPMIGRADELTAVLSLIDETTRSRRPRLITVTGVAGIGKTRLVREVVARQDGMRVLVGRCLAAGDGITFWALGEILRHACGIPLGDSGARAQHRLRAHLTSVFEGQQLTPAELDTTIFALATTAAVRLPDNPLDLADPRDVADELGRAWPRLASAYAARRPLLLVVEDLHWAGVPLVDMLSRLVARANGPVVVLTTA